MTTADPSKEGMVCSFVTLDSLLGNYRGAKDAVKKGFLRSLVALSSTFTVGFCV